MSEPDKTNGDGIRLPRWFLVLAGVVLPGAIAWAAWVSMQLVRLDIKLENVSNLGSRIQSVETAFHSHTAVPSIHHSMLARLSDRISTNEKNVTSRMDRIEKALEELKRTRK